MAGVKRLSLNALMSGVNDIPTGRGDIASAYSGDWRFYYSREKIPFLKAILESRTPCNEAAVFADFLEEHDATWNAAKFRAANPREVRRLAKQMMSSVMSMTDAQIASCERAERWMNP